MKRHYLLFFALLCLSFAFTTETSNNGKAAGKWVSLFNGKDLTDWQMKIVGFKLGENYGNTFRVENGILSVRYDQYDSFNNKFGALYYNKKFSNYRLKVEYRFIGELTKGAPSWGFRDSGVQYHCQAPGTVDLKQNFPVSLEYNLHGGNGKEERPVGQICANGIYFTLNGERNKSYCTDATTKRTFHGDQWVTLEIDVNNGVIKHVVNGEVILQYENPRFDPKHDIAKNFITAGNDQVKDGYISLQSNSHPIDFRKIEIMEY
jgi:hypothetical protein